jgi:hypothetical protein
LPASAGPVGVPALVLAATYDSMVPLTICRLTMAAAGGLGGFFPPPARAASATLTA